MTGAYVRIKRGDGYENVLIEHFTDQELDDFAAAHPMAGWKWAKFLARFIGDVESKLIEGGIIKAVE